MTSNTPSPHSDTLSGSEPVTDTDLDPANTELVNDFLVETVLPLQPPQPLSPAAESLSTGRNATLPPFLGDLTPPVNRRANGTFEINHAQHVDLLPINTRPDDLRPEYGNPTVFPLLVASRPPASLTRHLSTARYVFRRHQFWPRPAAIWKAADRPPHTFATDHAPILNRPYRYRSRGRAATASVLPQTVMTAWTYPFAIGRPGNPTDADFTGAELDHFNQGWSDAFARAVAAPLDFARVGTPMLPLAALYYHLGHSASAVNMCSLFEVRSSIGFVDAITFRPTAEAKPLGNPSGRPMTVDRQIEYFADEHYRGLSPGLGYAFQQLRQSSLTARQTETSGLNGTFAGGQHHRTLRDPDMIHRHLMPSQFVASNHPRPFWLSEMALQVLHGPLVPGLPYNFFDRHFATDSDPHVEAARDGGLVQAIRVACQSNERVTLEYAWRAYYRMLLGYFYRFGGDFTVIPGTAKTVDAAATRRANSEAHGATCVRFNTLDRLVESLRLVSQWIIELDPSSEIPMEPWLLKGNMKLGLPFAHPDDPHYHDARMETVHFAPARIEQSSVYQERRKLLSAFVTRPLPSQTMYGVSRRTIIHRGPTPEEVAAAIQPGDRPYDVALKNGIAYDPVGHDVYRRKRTGVNFCYGANTFYKGVRIRNLGAFTTKGMAAYLLRYGSNAAITDDQRVAYGGDLDYGAQCITDAARAAFPDWVGAPVDFERTSMFQNKGVQSRGEMLYTRSPNRFLFDEGYENRLSSFLSKNPGFRVPGLSRCAGTVNGHYLVNPNATPIVRGATMADTHTMKVLALLKARVYSWHEYLNAAIINYNRAALAMGDHFPRSQYLWRKSPTLRRHIKPPAELLNDRDPLSSNVREGFRFSELLSPEHDRRRDKLQCRARQVEAEIGLLQKELEGLDYIRDRTAYSRVQSAISYRRNKVLARIDEQLESIPVTENADAAYELLMGLVLLNQPHNSKDAETLVPPRFSRVDEIVRGQRNRYEKALDPTRGNHPASWGSLVVGDDTKHAASRKQSLIADAVADMTPIDADLDPKTRSEIEKAIASGEYFSPELMALIGSQHVAFDRSFPALETASWSEPLRNCVFEEFDSIKRMDQSEFVGDSFQFALARMTYYWMIDAYRYLRREVERDLRSMYDAHLKIAASKTHENVPEAFSEDVKAICEGFRKDKEATFSYLAIESDILLACENLRANHKTAYETVVRQKRFDGAAADVGIREQYRRELASTLPPLEVIDLVGNSQDDALQTAANDYLTGYQEIESNLTAYGAALWMFQATEPEKFALWLRKRNVVSTYALPTIGFEGGVHPLVEASSKLDNQHQPIVYHYCRALNPFLETMGREYPQTLKDLCEHSDQFVFQEALKAFAASGLPEDQRPQKQHLFENMANMLGATLAGLYMDEHPDEFDDPAKCLISTRYGVSLGDNDDLRAHNMPPVLMSTWSTRVDARHAALNTKRERQKYNLLHQVQTGRMMSPHRFAEEHLSLIDVGKALDVVVKQLGGLIHDEGWPIPDAGITPSSLKAQRRVVLGDVMMYLARKARLHPQTAKIVPHIDALGINLTRINPAAHPWWHAFAALAIERYMREVIGSTSFKVGDGVLAGDAPQFYIARNPGETT